jgi:hypothetical protein
VDERGKHIPILLMIKRGKGRKMVGNKLKLAGERGGGDA